MKNFIYYNNLFDIYESLFTEKEKQNFKDHYNEDLTISEIALNNNVSRSAIHKSLKLITEKLDFYENNLHVYKLKQELDSLKSNK